MLKGTWIKGEQDSRQERKRKQRFSSYLMKVDCEHTRSLVDTMLEGILIGFPIINSNRGIKSPVH